METNTSFNNKQKLGFAGKLAKAFVMNSKLSILVLVSIFIWGGLSFLLSPKQYNPEIVAPAFQVITELPGASAAEVQELITKPLEDKIMDISGVDEIISQSFEGAVSVVTVKFFVGENLEESKIKINQKIVGNIDEKPMGASTPVIKELNPNDVPIFTLALSSDQLSAVALRKMAFDVKEELSKVDNTTNIQVVGGKSRQAKVILNSDELTAKKVSITQIIGAIKQSNLKMLAGNLELPEQKILVEIDGTITNEEDLHNVVIASTGQEKIYLKDVAKVSIGEEETENIVRFRSKNVEHINTVFISIAKKNGTNITDVTQDLQKKIEDLKKTSIIPTLVTAEVVADEGSTASEEISGLVINLIQAIIIVTLILLFFLGSRPALIVAVAIPLTLAGVFGVGLLAGQTINRITLFALILSLGLLVDNATVVVENIVRHLKFGKERKVAVIEAVDEVGVGLLMSTITTLFAFFPMAFVTGMMGPYMGPIPFFVPVALIISLIVAFTLNPFLSAYLIKDEDVKKQSKLSQLQASFQKKEAVWMAKYKELLHKLFVDDVARKKMLKKVIIIFLITASFPMIGLVKFRMLPKADRNQFYIYLNLPQSGLLEQSDKITNVVENYLLQEKNVVSVQSFVGTPPILDFNGLFKGADGRNTDNLSTIKVNLTDSNNRSKKSEDIVIELRPKLEELLSTYPDTKFQLVEDPPGPPVLSTILAKVQGENTEEARKISYDIENFFSQTKEVVDTDTTRSENVQKVLFKINSEKAAAALVSLDKAAYALQVALSGANISVLHDEKNKEQEYVFIKLDKEDRNSIEDLQSIYVSNERGEKVPLIEIADVTNISAEDVLYRDGREQTIYVYGEMGKRSVVYAVIDLFGKLLDYKLPSGQGEISKFSLFGVEYIDRSTGDKFNVAWGGEWELTLEVFRDLGTAMIVAIFLIYAVLVAQFHSFKTPLIIMGTIPLALIGVMPGFFILDKLFGIYFNATSMIGVIALAGIVVNNAIILVEYLNGLRGKGLSAEEALIEAGQTRLRPIVLTSLTTILGSFTIIGDPVWAGLGWAIIFGLSISTMLTLIIFPVLYYTFEGKDWVCHSGQTCEGHGPTLN